MLSKENLRSLAGLMIVPPTSLATSRLTLCAARHEHAASLFREYTGKKDAVQYLQRNTHSSQAQTETIIDAWGESNWLTGRRFVWSILQKSDQKAIGLFLMFIDGYNAEIHYGLGPAFWGKGFASEAGITIMEW